MLHKVVGVRPENTNMDDSSGKAGNVGVFVARNAHGEIIGVDSQPLRADATYLSLADPELQDYMRRLDLDLVRVIEDVVDLLISRGVFRFTDLPETAQQKLSFRKNVRSRWQTVADPLSAEEPLI